MLRRWLDERSQRWWGEGVELFVIPLRARPLPWATPLPRATPPALGHTAGGCVSPVSAHPLRRFSCALFGI